MKEDRVRRQPQRRLEANNRLVVFALSVKSASDVVVDGSQMRGQPQRLGVARERLVELFELAVGVAEIVVGDGRIGLKTNGLLAVRQCGLRLLAIQQQLAEIALRYAQLRVQLNGAAKMSKRLLSLPQEAVSVAAIVVSQGVIGPPAEDVLEDGDGLSRLVHSQQNAAKIQGRIDSFRVQTQRFAAAGRGTRQIAASLISLAQVSVKYSRSRFTGHGALDQLDGLAPLAALQHQHAQQVQSFRIVRMLSKDCAIDSLGRLEITASMMRDCFR